MICFNNFIVCLKRPKINKKEAGVGPIFLRIVYLLDDVNRTPAKDLERSILELRRIAGLEPTVLCKRNVNDLVLIDL